MLPVIDHSAQTTKSAVRPLYSEPFIRLLSLAMICVFFSVPLFSSAVSAQAAGISRSDPSSAFSSGVSIASASQGASGASASASSEPSSLGQTSLLDPAGEGSPAIDGKAYVLYDAQSGTFLLGKNQDTPLSPASITKVMTVLLALEHLKMTDTIIVTRDMFKDIPNDYTRLGLVSEEEITVEEALYACLLISANDAALALAITIGGSEEAFVAMMNAKAAELGCSRTHFTNPYGLADKEHLTTAHDMALIMAEALKNEMYTTISTTRHYPMPATNKFAEPRGIINGNRFITAKKYAYEHYIGGKTGYTDMSRFTITAGARQDGRTLVSVILGASTSDIRYANLISLFSYGFSAYSTEHVDPAEYEDIRTQAVSQVASAIDEAGYTLSVSDSTLVLDDYTTTTSARSMADYSSVYDINIESLRPDLPSQVLHIPLYRRYSDGTRSQVGTLDVTVTKVSSQGTSSEVASDPGTGAGRRILGTAVMIVLAAILLFGVLILYSMIRRELKRRRRRRRHHNANHYRVRTNNQDKSDGRIRRG
ncbi:MAG: D-alanyl-D-alanine carboxypeptidase family protein [Saccharofermentanales bacterium]